MKRRKRQTDLSVECTKNTIVTRFSPQWNEEPFEVSIALVDVVMIIIETSTRDMRHRLLHWFLEHRDGWTLYFHNGFAGAPAVEKLLTELPGFDQGALAAARAAVDREDFVVWRSARRRGR